MRTETEDRTRRIRKQGMITITDDLWEFSQLAQKIYEFGKKIGRLAGDNMLREDTSLKELAGVKSAGTQFERMIDDGKIPQYYKGLLEVAVKELYFKGYEEGWSKSKLGLSGVR